MKLYTLTRIPGGSLELRAQAEVVDRDKRGRAIGKHVETDITSAGYDTGNATQESLSLARAIMRHYYGASDTDPAATAEAVRQAPRFLDAFLIHHAMPRGAKFELSSEVLDRFFAA